MSDSAQGQEASPAWVGPRSSRTFLGHPVGLFVLFFTEMWERFSYYGMRGLLKLYMVNFLFVGLRQVLQGGTLRAAGNPDAVIGWPAIRSLLPTLDAEQIRQCVEAAAPRIAASGVAAADVLRVAQQGCAVQPMASVIYGWYTGLVYLTPVLGGFLADRYLGQKRAVFVGGAVMAAGQFILFGAEDAFFIGLLFLIIGNGFFKPNISTQVGNLYPPGDRRRDGAFTIFYMGINLGAFICNFICGTLAAVYGWRYGFLAAGVGMLIGLLVQAVGQAYLAPDTLQSRAALAARSGQGPADLVREPREAERVIALVALCMLNVVFWAVYEQQGNTMQTWADEKTVWPVIGGFQLPSTWFQSFNPFFIFVFAPLLDRLWAWQARRGREPSSVIKMALGSGILGLSFILMVIGALLVGGGKGSLFWPAAATLLLTFGELYLSPIGLSLVTKVAPVRLVSMMMGIWYLSSFFGNLLCGYIGVLYSRWSPPAFFLFLMALGLLTAAAIGAFNRPLRKAMGGHG